MEKHYSYSKAADLLKPQSDVASAYSFYQASSITSQGLPDRHHFSYLVGLDLMESLRIDQSLSKSIRSPADSGVVARMKDFWEKKVQDLKSDVLRHTVIGRVLVAR